MKQFYSCRASFSFAAALALSAGVIAASSADAATSNPCEIPFTEMVNPHTGRSFTLRDAVNQNQNVSESFNYRNRFIVTDLNTLNEEGQCKGVEEHYPMIDAQNPDLNAFPDLEDSSNLGYFLSSIQGSRGSGFYARPQTQQPITVVNGTRYCTGQTVSFCEIRDGQVVEIMRLATSAERSNTGSSLYESLNLVTMRSWAVNRPYTAMDARHDQETGGILAGQRSGVRLSHYTSGGGWVMPNFVKWDAAPGFQTRGYMGLHQLTQGESPIVVPGSPVSHGCFRLSKYGAVLNRWWTPFGAKMFIRSDASKYRQRPPTSLPPTSR